MPLLTVDDLRNEMAPAYQITEVSHPSVADCARFIDEIDGEVQALWISAGGVWPAPGSTGATGPRLIEVLGVKWRYLDARFSAASSSMVPDAVAQARLAYNDRLGRIKDLATGASGGSNGSGGSGTGTGAAPYRGPRTAVGQLGRLHGPTSLTRWTEQRDPMILADYYRHYIPWEGGPMRSTPPSGPPAPPPEDLMQIVTVTFDAADPDLLTGRVVYTPAPGDAISVDSAVRVLQAFDGNQPNLKLWPQGEVGDTFYGPLASAYLGNADSKSDLAGHVLSGNGGFGRAGTYAADATPWVVAFDDGQGGDPHITTGHCDLVLVILHMGPS